MALGGCAFEGVAASGMNQTLGTLVSARTPHRTGITVGLKRNDMRTQ